MHAETAEQLEQGKRALANGDWETARELLGRAVSGTDDPDVKFHYARAAEWAGDYRDAVKYYERAFTGYCEKRRFRDAAFIAGRELSFLHAAVYGNAPVAEGWLQRALDLAHDIGDCTEAGWVELAAALMTDDPDTKDRHIARAEAITEMTGDVNLRFAAMAHAGVSRVLRGQIVEGIRLLDASATAVISGEVTDYLVAGEIFCHMLFSCEAAQDVVRAQRWLTAATEYGARSHADWIPAICRTHFGGILTAAGRLTDAEEQLSSALRLYDASYEALRSSAMVRLADLRVRQGRFDEAARMLAGFEFDSFAVRPLARLHFARGDLGMARRVLGRVLTAECTPMNAPHWALLTEIAVATDDMPTAIDAESRLTQLARRCELPSILAYSEYACGLVREAAGKNGDALTAYDHSLKHFSEAALPLEAARTRLAIARLTATTDPKTAASEAQTALRVFETLAARFEADQTASLLRQLGQPGRRSPRTPGPLTNRENEVLHLVSEGFTNDEIADRLFLSKRTVEHHISSIFRKLGVSSRAEAIAAALRGSGE
ncbi:LuxR C-terminal-related transcriptional regulator [Hoyosella subflava]|uniref:Regulatory protein, LuxR n=1 Tax=Hoyosella subflava (strain DSM 45089 / JCM 17490 / NBRC 109087 / DQS3-9A1) TaxID=443218 RepID=F6EJ52_HOYSD|nr:LuxR C-terminal-related transcriptional regulator [Hoyosella subflava]AEF41284.1 Regulatory protein, LuxR [Hoyosella subflava DQS3-9A1]